MAPSHYLNQCWNIIDLTLGNKLQWNIDQNLYILIQENACEDVVWKMVAILCFGLIVLKNIPLFQDWNLWYFLNHILPDFISNEIKMVRLFSSWEGQPQLDLIFKAVSLWWIPLIVWEIKLTAVWMKPNCEWRTSWTGKDGYLGDVCTTSSI